MILRQHGHQLQHLIHMAEPHGIRRPIVGVIPLADKIIRNHLEITVETPNGCFRQTRDLKQVDLIVVHIWPDLFRNLYDIENRSLFPPRLISKIQNQRHDRIPVRRFKLRTVRRPVIPDHPKRHVTIIGCLILDPK